MSWAQVPFDSIIADSAFGPRFSGDCYAVDGNVATLRTTDLSIDGVISLSTMPEATIAEEKFADHFLQVGDLVISRSGRIGTTAVFSGYHKPVLPGAFLIRFRLDKEKANPLFYRYFFNSAVGQQRLLSVARGAAQQNINITNVRTLPVPLPSLKVQELIASRLSEFDNLIENNRRRIALLEQSARLLYREWFVHLRFPGHEHVKVVDGVPQGWKRKTMADVAETVGGGTPSTAVSAYWDDGEITWFSPTDLTNNDCLALLTSGKKITDAGLKNSSAKMLPPDTILMSSRASIGYFGLHDKPACTNQGFISLIPRDEQYRYYLLYNLMFRKDEIESKAGGTTYKEINKSTFRGMTITWPEKALASSFSEFAMDVMQQVRALKRQNEKLAQARDLLLPRLMSGGRMC